MRCAHCGSLIKYDPLWNNGIAFCCLDCVEESAIALDGDFVDDAPATELHSLFGADDDDDY